MKRTILKSISGMFVLLLMLSGNASAESFEDGVEAYKQGDFVTAYKLFLTVAKQGDSRAQLKLGDMVFYAEGGHLMNFPKAAEWYRKAAEQGLKIGRAHV